MPARRVACAVLCLARCPVALQRPGALRHSPGALRHPARSVSLRAAPQPDTDSQPAAAAGLPELPIDFGSNGSKWNFEWQDLGAAVSAEDAWTAKDVGTGSVAFIACYLNAVVAADLLLADAPVAQVAGRVSATAAFFALQNAAGEKSPVPLRRGLSFADVAGEFRWTQSLKVSKVGDVAWPLVAAGASVPVFQAILVPLFLLRPQDWAPPDHLVLPSPTEFFEVVCVVPVTEELFFRFFLLETARRANFGYAPSILASAAAFAAWHGPNPTSLALGVLGAYWGHMYSQTRNILVPMTMHALWNAFTLLSKSGAF
ncbi:CAAX protease self-immunity-domain-containing protein [Pelagophyceae sp. CCMP2097]|nr:CAAX protease self-immunity-domain-containing protein [Pelagophyceae sp. CCMP2097]|mmetsp:Transcript_29481/g.101953  ORF Transcript_29481/g.101953 Transcript_29481/m.101953 type:complete len:315 (+) Transcript_29481:37-981(+)